MKRILGLDLGTRTLGVSISDPLGIIASGVETFRFKDSDFDSAVEYVVKTVQEKNVSEIVIGLPKHMNGDLGDKAQLVMEFSKKIQEKIDIKIVQMDERWTTKVAERRLLDADLSRKKRKTVIDKMAAVEILQNYLDMKK